MLADSFMEGSVAALCMERQQKRVKETASIKDTVNSGHLSNEDSAYSPHTP